MRFGRYEVVGELGRGGMGVVYKARSDDGRVVAVKVLLDPDPDALARFEREERLQGLFNGSSGFVPLLDSGDSPEGRFLVMPFLPGGTLRDRLKREGQLGVDETIELGRALARALGMAHRFGVVHRDLKPENIIFDAEKKPLVADLGLAKHSRVDGVGAARSVSLSKTGQIAGTAGYYAPEQVDDSKRVAPPADVFALGAILYECLTGARALDGMTGVVRHASTPGGIVKPIRAQRPEVPEGLEAIVLRALAPSASERFSSGSALLEALATVDTRRKGPRRGLALALAALAVLAVLGGVGAMLERRRASMPVTEVLPHGLRHGERGSFLFRLPDGGDMELVKVPKGDFTMGAQETGAPGSERPAHRHAMPDDYWIGKYDVTWTQYLSFCALTKRDPPGTPRTPNKNALRWWKEVSNATSQHPVVNVSHEDAAAYCKWAGLALPTEAQWEKAARGTDGRIFPWGSEPWDPTRANILDSGSGTTLVERNKDDDGEFKVKPVAYWRNKQQHDPLDPRDDGYPFTSPVGSFPAGASPYGALDMVGNAGQLCADYYDKKVYERYARGAFDPPPPTADGFFVVRGGSWYWGQRGCRVTGRGWGGKQGSWDRGFRVVLAP